MLAGFAAAVIGLQTAAEIYGAVVVVLALVTVTGLRVRRLADTKDPARVPEVVPA